MVADLAARHWVLLPGTLCSGQVFGGFLGTLGVPESMRHTVALRHPAVEDYTAELTEACTPGAVICGFSLGAIVAAHLADRLPAATFLLFGLNPQADHPDKRRGRLNLAADVERLGGAGAMASRLPVLAGPAPDRARRLILDMAEASAGDIAAQTSLALGRPGALDALSRTKAPVWLFTGTQDTSAPHALAEAAAQAAPRGRVIPLDGLGHYALAEDPAACASAVKQTLATVTPFKNREVSE